MEKMARILKKSLFFISIALLISGCAHHPAVLTENHPTWKSFDRCYAQAGYYTFVDRFEINLSLMGFKHIAWIFIGQGDLDIEFVDSNPEIEIILEPDHKQLRVKPKFRIMQWLNAYDPIFKVPKGMKAQYDFKREKMVYGKSVQPWLGPSRFEVKGELSEPRQKDRMEVSPRINTKPDPGYIRTLVEGIYPIEAQQAEVVRVILPAVRINGKELKNREFTFRRGTKYGPSYPAESCSSLLPPGLRDPVTRERFF